VYFDRGLIDAAANLQFMTGEPVLATLGHLTVTIGECF
jgi:predicted ATPase